MERVRRYFGAYSMTWPRVILLAVITGTITAVLNLIPALDDTSFQDIAVNLDWWILFAVFLIVNCKGCLEAMLKCFVFFLISQPLIYLIQVPFSAMGWGLFGYYKYWFGITVLTIPGAAVAYQLKRKDWRSVLVLSVATGYLAFMSVSYLHSVMLRAPRHLLSCLFCLALAVFFILVLLEQKKHRIAALVIAGIVLLASFGFLVMGMGGTSTFYSLEDGNWSYTLEDDSIVSVDIQGGNGVTLTSRRNGSTVIHFTRDDGLEESFTVDVKGRSIFLNEIAREEGPKDHSTK